MEHHCAICKKESADVGVLIGGDPDRMICDECIIKASDLYAGANAIPVDVVLNVMRYRRSLRNIAQRQKQAAAEMARAAEEHPDLANPNGLDPKRS